MDKSFANQRKILEAERKKRIFNDKIRTIGIDVKALNEQIEQKVALKNAEKAKNMKIEQEILDNDRKAAQYQAIEDQNSKVIKQKLAIGYLRPNSSMGIRLCPRPKPKPFYHEFHVSSAQKFDGEDPDWKTNQRLKAKTLKMQLDQQLDEKREIDRKIVAENQKWDNITSYQSSVGRILESEERKVSRMMKMTCLDENRRLVKDKILRKAFDIEKENCENQMDIATQVCSDFLRETPQQAKSMAGNHRILPDRWKGMNKMEKDTIFQEQRNQTQLKAFEKGCLLREKKSYDEQIVSDVHSWRLLERESQRDFKDECKQLARFNQQLALVQKAKNQIINREARNNVPTDEFFNQFGTSAR